MNRTVDFAKGSVIFHQGDWEMSMFEIVSGRVGIYSDYGTAGEKLLTELEAGKFFGEMGMVQALPRSATAVALQDTRLNIIVYAELDSYIRVNPDKVLTIVETLSERLREMTHSYLDACNAVAEYVQEDKPARKGGLKEKIKKMVAFSESYSQWYNEMMAKDPAFAASMSANMGLEHNLMGSFFIAPW